MLNAVPPNLNHLILNTHDEENFDAVVNNINNSAHDDSLLTTNDEDDITIFEKLRQKYMSNPIIAYYNINSLRNKIIDIRYIMLRCLPDVFVMAETKLNYQFPNSQFLVENYYEPTRVDDTSESGGLIEYTRKGIINKRKTEFELKSFSSICSELTINKIKWLVLSFYRKPYGKNIDLFFSELTMSMNIAICKYDNIVIIGDINIDSDSELTSDFEKLSSF